MEPMDFQEATAQRILQLFKDEKQKRVLLSDEVGLGKTIIARAVVKKVSDWHKEWDDHFKVVYICSNINIANQNCRKLGIPEEDCLSFSEGRLSMQHLRLAEAENKEHSYQQLIPMTPATSFDMKSRVGTQNERALIYAILCNYKELSHHKTRLKHFMKYDWELKHWDSTVDGYVNRVNTCDKACVHYISDMLADLDSAFNENDDNKELYKELLLAVSEGNVKKFNRDKHKKIILELRKIFAKISLKKLEPDLVIMDEFQRFKDLLNTQESSEESLLADHFIRNDKTKVLLLSATPYKPFTTFDELANGEEEHYKEFMGVIDILLDDKNKRESFDEVWKDYSNHLLELKSEDFSALIVSKQAAEKKMYECICRTERRNEAIIDVAGASAMQAISDADVSSYIEMQSIMEKYDMGNFPIDYVKSAPYLMSYMNYVIKDNIEKNMGDERNIPEITDSKTLFLRKNIINKYEKVTCNNARLERLFVEAFGKGKKNGAEMLLWIPASRPYYRTNNEFSQNAGYTKTLIFSSWEMVPRVIASLTSYEAERLVVERLPESTKRKSYFAEELESEAEALAAENKGITVDDIAQTKDNNKRRRRKTSIRLRKEVAELLKYPSKTLVDIYNPIETMDMQLSDIRSSVGSKISAKIGELRRAYNLPDVRKSAANILALIKALDGNGVGKLEGIPNDVERLLVNLAIGGPATCALRLFDDKNLAIKLAGRFVSLFNKPESMAILDALYPNEGYYYDAVARYCAGGNLQAVLDEYAYILGSSGKELCNMMCEAFVDTVSIPVETRDSFVKKEDKARLRCHFAVGYYNTKVSENSVQRTENIRASFNSPFRPFVLASTSIGQEGLDFHNYSRKIMHWNLPSNPIDLEQREGRINRFMCHAIRQNIAENDAYRRAPFESDVWKEMVLRAKEDLKKDNSDLIPYWCLPDDYKYTRKIERIVPMYPYSMDEVKYSRLISILALYRMTLGQPRQEELYESLKKKDLDPEKLKDLYMDLSPWSHNHKKSD